MVCQYLIANKLKIILVFYSFQCVMSTSKNVYMITLLNDNGTIRCQCVMHTWPPCQRGYMISCPTMSCPWMSTPHHHHHANKQSIKNDYMITYHHALMITTNQPPGTRDPLGGLTCWGRGISKNYYV